MSDDSTLDAIWCIDSETGRKYLIDRKTNKIVAEMDKDGIIIPEGHK